MPLQEGNKLMVEQELKTFFFLLPFLFSCLCDGNQDGFSQFILFGLTSILNLRDDIFCVLFTVVSS